ncbi:hypothetical protein [Azospirillum thermophilum]|uniref:Uncharacterized protein n=1 Tax=Azospirillum thermophilum TaxID=2202148 RepID=A0A2S2CTY5_9PROT|nr:hypothetical protein [Azospirillum thermophilum]AWK87737.1 hypothetical protein DEW08_17395 [Azospirillum thermophilum]
MTEAGQKKAAMTAHTDSDHADAVDGLFRPEPKRGLAALIGSVLGRRTTQFDDDAAVAFARKTWKSGDATHARVARDLLKHWPQ